MIGLLAVAASALVAVIAGTPPNDPPQPVELGGTPERRLAELSFAVYLTLEFDTDPGAFSCARPDGQSDRITCFALTVDERVIAAITSSSAGTGVYDWQVVANRALQPTEVLTTSSSVDTTTPGNPDAGSSTGGGSGPATGTSGPVQAIPAGTDAPGETASADLAVFERQLAELSFGIFVTVELDVSPDVFTCTEPASAARDESLTCFAMIDDQRVVIASTLTSGATGMFEFDVLADYEIVEPNAPDTIESAPLGRSSLSVVPAPPR